MRKKDPIQEAKRYLANGDKLLRENCTVDNYGHYSDDKYVKMAGHTAWKAVLVALDPLHEPLKSGKKKSKESYEQILHKKAKSLVSIYDSTYNALHIYMGYDGNTSTYIKKGGWKEAKILIDWASKHQPPTLAATKTRKTVKKL